MTKKTLGAVITILSIIASCELMNREKTSDNLAEQGQNDEKQKIDELSRSSGSTQPLILNHSQSNGNTSGENDDQMNDEDPQQTQPTPPIEPSPKPITQYDSKALDEKVIAQATALGADPKTYRMLIKDDNGFKVFRMIGMHVLVSPNGEEVFLPDEL